MGQVHGIDAKVLDTAAGKLEVTKKTLVRKAVIELENLTKKGNSVLT